MTQTVKFTADQRTRLTKILIRIWKRSKEDSIFNTLAALHPEPPARNPLHQQTTDDSILTPAWSAFTPIKNSSELLELIIDQLEEELNWNLAQYYDTSDRAQKKQRKEEITALINQVDALQASLGKFTMKLLTALIANLRKNTRHLYRRCIRV